MIFASTTSMCMYVIHVRLIELESTNDAARHAGSELGQLTGLDTLSRTASTLEIQHGRGRHPSSMLDLNELPHDFPLLLPPASPIAALWDLVLGGDKEGLPFGIVYSSWPTAIRYQTCSVGIML